MTTIPAQQIPEPAPAAAPAPVALKRSVALRNFSMVIALVAIWVFFTAANPSFVGARNLSNLAVELSITAVLSLGMLLILLLGHVDLSIGSGVGLFGGIAAVLIFQHNWSAPAAMVVAAAIALLVWLAMGSLIVIERIPAFIITLAGMLVFRGLHWLTIGSRTVYVQVGGEPNLVSILTTWFLPPVAGYILVAAVWAVIAWSNIRQRQRRLSFGLTVDSREIMISKLILWAQGLLLFVLVCSQYRGIPLAAVILGAVAVIIFIITQHTRFGRYLYAVGGNEEAALISGVPVRKVVIAAFGIMGLLTALGGFMQAAYVGASTTTAGSLFELDAIAACVIGGTSLKGGRGTVLGVIFGALIMASLINGMTLMSVRIEYNYIARGLVLALAVWMDVRLAQKAGQH